MYSVIVIHFVVSLHNTSFCSFKTSFQLRDLIKYTFVNVYVTTCINWLHCWTVEPVCDDSFLMMIKMCVSIVIVPL